MDDTEVCWDRKQQMQSFCGEKDLDVLEEQRRPTGSGWKENARIYICSGRRTRRW